MAIADYCCIPQRYVLGIMGFFAIANLYTMRVSFSVAFTEMVVKHTANKTIGEAICEKSAFGEDIDPILFTSSKTKKFDFSEKLQGTILSSFFWGYTITHFPGGIIADKFGGKWTLGLGLLSTAIFTGLTPLLAKTWGAPGLIITRSVMGLGEGTTFPALTVLLAHWIPLKERGTIGAFAYGGAQVGGMLGNAVTGLLINRTGSWEIIFYFWGIVGITWFIIFSLTCYDDPSSHPFIKDSEKEYLLEELGKIDRNHNLPPVPIKAMLTNCPLLTFIVSLIGHSFAFDAMTTDLPKYMADVLQLSVKKNGYYVALSFLVMWIISIISGFISDWVIGHKFLSLTNARKVWTLTSFMGPAIFGISASYAGCRKTLVIVLFTLCMGFKGFWYAGMKLNALDLSPNYSGTAMALAGGMGASMGIVGPLLIGFLTPHSSLQEWRIVFWIVFVVFSVSSVIIALFASAEVQPWNEPDKMEKNKS